jgi:hypothetical protein
VLVAQTMKAVHRGLQTLQYGPCRQMPAQIHAQETVAAIAAEQTLSLCSSFMCEPAWLQPAAESYVAALNPIAPAAVLQHAVNSCSSLVSEPAWLQPAAGSYVVALNFNCSSHEQKTPPTCSS